LSHRLLSHASAERILFLVDRANLRSQTVREFQGCKPSGSTLVFSEEFPVQHLRGRTLDTAAQVVVCTIQRLYACLRGEDLDEAEEQASGFEAPAAAVQRPVAYNADIPPAMAGCLTRRRLSKQHGVEQVAPESEAVDEGGTGGG